ncbi:MAG: hypothetical protein ACOY4I_11225 [Bacillota bacterium]
MSTEKTGSEKEMANIQADTGTEKKESISAETKDEPKDCKEDKNEEAIEEEEGEDFEDEDEDEYEDEDEDEDDAGYDVDIETEIEHQTPEVIAKELLITYLETNPMAHPDTRPNETRYQAVGRAIGEMYNALLKEIRKKDPVPGP